MHQRKQAEERHKLMKKMVAANLYEKVIIRNFSPHLSYGQDLF